MKISIAQQRLWNEHLVGEPFATPLDVVRHLVAVQSQDYPGAKWGVAQRTKGLTSDAFDKLFNDGKILRTHVMRPTWHFVMPEDIRWLLELTAPRVNALMTHYNRILELDDKFFRRCEELFADALRGGKYLTRTELGDALETKGIKARGQRLAHIVMHAELEAIMCSGPLKGKQFTYALLAERAPKAKRLEHEEALAELAGRYFASHGPATPQDFSWWSGLTVAQAKKAIELTKPRLEHEIVDGQTYWFASSQPKAKEPGPTMHLLPNYDEFLIAYKGYGAIFNAGELPSNAIDSLRAHIIVRNGKVIGGWKRTITKNQIDIKTDLLVKLSKGEQTALKAAAREYGTFMGLAAHIEPL